MKRKPRKPPEAKLRRRKPSKPGGNASADDDELDDAILTGQGKDVASTQDDKS